MIPRYWRYVDQNYAAGPILLVAHPGATLATLTLTVTEPSYVRVMGGASISTTVADGVGTLALEKAGARLDSADFHGHVAFGSTSSYKSFVTTQQPADGAVTYTLMGVKWTAGSTMNGYQNLIQLDIARA